MSAAVEQINGREAKTATFSNLNLRVFLPTSSQPFGFFATLAQNSMSKSAINYLFPPDQINNLASWRFILHFKLPSEFTQTNLNQAIEQLKAAQWRIIKFPFGLDNLTVSEESQSVGVPIEVTEENRKRINALADYESDFWKVCGNMMENGFGDVYYEAIDWQEE